MTKDCGITITWELVLTLVLMSVLSGMACLDRNAGAPLAGIPNQNLWAWERPEDFSWLSANDGVGIAYLSQTLVIKGDTIDVRRRMQPLKIRNGIFLTAVTRIETGRGKESATFSNAQLTKIKDLVAATSKIKDVKAVQIDFDAAKTERQSYAALLEQTRSALPPDMQFSITAIASWCYGDNWFEELPVDDVIPMVFEMGPDSRRIRRNLEDGNDWQVKQCRNSYGIAKYDRVEDGIREGRRFYYFNNRPWKRSDLNFILGEK